MNNYITLKINNNFKMNLNLIKEKYQDKEHLDYLNYVKVKLIIKIMQLNILNKMINNQILQNCKLVNKYNL